MGLIDVLEKVFVGIGRTLQAGGSSVAEIAANTGQDKILPHYRTSLFGGNLSSLLLFTQTQILIYSKTIT